MIDSDKLNRYFRGDSSQQEKEEIQLWLEESEENNAEFMSLRALHDITLCSLPEQGIRQFNHATRKNRHILFEWTKIAAAILITFGVSYYFLNGSSNEEIKMQTLHVPAGQRAELTLTDGTKVWLNSLTTFTFPNRFTEESRRVHVDGEAYFDVKQDNKKKFTVNTGAYDIHVLGTEFNVIAYSKDTRFETSLITGSVEIEACNGSQKLLLYPGKKAYLKNNQLVTVPLLDDDLFLWRDGILNFRNERVEEILSKLELYYNIKIINQKHTIKDIRYTGKFRIDDGVEHVMNVLKIAIGLRYTRDSENNTISIN